MSMEIANNETSDLYKKVEPIIQAALGAVDPYHCTKSFLKLKENKLQIGENQYHLDDLQNLYIIGTGKAVLPMALAAQDCLHEKITSGCLIAKHHDIQIQKQLTPNIHVLIGSHPVPSNQSVDSTQQLVSFLENLTEKDLVICLISGGGSALMTLPHQRISLEDMQEVTRQLLFSGATINEVNIVRKHLDQVKGGGLAKRIWPARMVTLVLSDVIGDSLDAIASGPTVPDSSTYQDVMEIITRYHLASRLPGSVMALIREGVEGLIEETVKPGDACVADTKTYIVGSLALAAEAADQKALTLGWNTLIQTTHLEGEARQVGENLGKELINIVQGKHPIKKPGCIISGGETTVTVKGDGKGGRNQETALSAAITIEGLPDCLFISLATDGEDGPTDAAGAAVDGKTIRRGDSMGLDALDYLNRNDAYPYLNRTGSLIKIGPTGTNVNDLVFLFAF